jgi:outer membrane murein-binding lipoprotein Lpp
MMQAASVHDPNSRRARQYQQLHTQLERLQRNVEQLRVNAEAAAEQVEAARRLGIIHASM